MGAITIVLVAGLITTGGLLYAIEEDYLPIGLETREPVGAKLSARDLEKEYRYLLNEIPGAKDLTYEVYESDSKIPVIRDDYIVRLTSDGYSHDFSGAKVVKGVLVYYNGFIKGATGVAVFVASGDSFGLTTGENVVLYTTGSVTTYQEIYNYYVGE